MYLSDEIFKECDIETGDLVKHVDNKLFLAIHDNLECQWLLVGMDGSIGEHVKSYTDLAQYYKLYAKSNDLRLTIDRP